MRKECLTENEIYVAPVCEVINLEMEDSVLITGSNGEASHDSFWEEDYSDKVVWE